MPAETVSSMTDASAPPTPTSVKHFVLDTNVLLHNPNALFVFQDNHVIIPYPVIEELDKMKRRDDDIGRNARAAIRHLDVLRRAGKLTDGVDWGGIPVIAARGFGGGPDGRTGSVRIDVVEHERPPVIAEESPDNRIIAVAHDLKRQGLPAVFVSKDLSARIKSDTLGIKTEDFENQKVDADRLYTGYSEVNTPRVLIDELYADRMLPVERYLEQATVYEANDPPPHEPQPNEFVLMQQKRERMSSSAGSQFSSGRVVPRFSPARLACSS